jgi:hypothetical protein
MAVLDTAIQKKTSDFNLRLDCRVKPGNDSAGSVQTQHALAASRWLAELTLVFDGVGPTALLIRPLNGHFERPPHDPKNLSAEQHPAQT